MWVAAAVLWALAGGALLTGASGVGLLMVGAAALLAGLCAYYRRRQPLGYRVEPDALVVVERAGERRIDGPVANAARRRPRPARVRLGRPVRLPRPVPPGRPQGSARAYVSDLRRVAVVDVGDVARRHLAGDKAAFLQEAHDA